jgi:hypothetical protein
MNMAIFNTCCPEKYKGKLFLTSTDIQDILQLGINTTYEYLKSAPFRVVRVGNQLRIVAAWFWEWYSTIDDDETGGEGLHK